MEYLSAAAAGLGHLFSWPGILIPAFGTLLVMITSFLPGIGSTSLIALLVVFTITWEPVSVMLLFGALIGGATFMGSITAILFNIPGSTTSAATLLDGYPLARRGYPQMAIACAATASAVGSVVGVVVLMLLLPVIRPFLLQFGPFELLLLGIWGLATLIAVPNASPLKAAVMCLLGFVVAMIGQDPVSGAERWSFGSLELLAGIPFLPVLLGIFTLAELITWVRRYDLGPSTMLRRARSDSSRRGIASVFRHWGVTLRSAIIGTVVGIIPGVGGTVAGFVAYGQTVQNASGSTDRFGKGDVRGLVAPEAAVDAKDGGSLLPVVAFGLPGSETGVILVSVMAIHGLSPGLPMLSTNLDLTYTLIFALLLSNLLTSVVGLGLAPYLARLTELRIDRIILPAMLVSLLAVVQIDNQVSDIFLAVIFGIGGYFLKRHDWPRVPFVIAFILGSFLESNLSLSLQLIDVGRLQPLTRPASLILFALLLVSLWWMLRKRQRAASALTTQTDLGVALVLLAPALLLLVTALRNPATYSGLTTGIAGLLAASLALVAVLALRAPREAGTTPGVPHDHRLPIAALSAVPVLLVLVGLPLAMGLVVLGWMRTRAASWGKAALFALSTTAAVWVFVEQISYVILPEPWLFSLLG